MTHAEVLGTPVAPWDVNGLVASVIDWANALLVAQRTILYANVHVLNSAYVLPQLREALRAASTVYCDGSGVRLGAWLLGLRMPPRITGADWIDGLCTKASTAGVSLFLLGGSPGVAERAAAILSSRYPTLRITGTHHGYLTPDVSGDVVERINSGSPHVVLVGMGTPAQELWISHTRSQLHAPVVWAVGALFDFVAGVERRGPRWMLDHHLEWVARLLSNPRTHWRRYLVGNPIFLARVLRQRLFGLPARFSRAAAGQRSGYHHGDDE